MTTPETIAIALAAEWTAQERADRWAWGRNSSPVNPPAEGLKGEGFSNIEPAGEDHDRLAKL
jgi:hypothetical protein